MLRLHDFQMFHHVDEILIGRGRGPAVARDRVEHTFLEIAHLALPRRHVLFRRVGEMHEIAAHQPARLVAVAFAGLAIAIAHFPQPAELHGGGERRDHVAKTEPAGEFDGRARKARHIGGYRPLHRPRRHEDILEFIEPALVGHRFVFVPQPEQYLDPLDEGLGIVVERHLEGRVFALVITPPAGEIDPPAAQQIERRPLFGDPDRMVQRQDIDRRGKTNSLGHRGDRRQHDIGAGQHAESREMMLADPGRMHADFLGIHRLFADIGDEFVRTPGIVFVIIVAQREVAEFHFVILTAVISGGVFIRAWIMRDFGVTVCANNGGGYHDRTLYMDDG